MFFGCTYTEKIYDKNGDPLLLIGCGSAFSISMCHSVANDECPYGYKTIHESPGFNRNEIRVRCIDTPPENR